MLPELSLPSAHTPMLPDLSLLNRTIQGTAASLHLILSDPPSAECCSTQQLFIYLLLHGFLNDATKTTQNTTSTNRMISQ
jgi:hypothetical protein